MVRTSFGSKKASPPPPSPRTNLHPDLVMVATQCQMSCVATWCHVLSHGVMCCHMVSWSHAVMYYRISFRPLQIQFLVMLVHCIISLLIECAYDRRPQWILFFYLLSHIALFSNFYRNAYIKPKGTSDGGSDAALQKKARQKKEQ